MPIKKPATSQRVLDKLNEVAGQVRDLHVVLLGGPDMETEHGRLPKLEAEVEDHGKRLTALEKAMVRYVGVVAGAGIILSLIVHLFEGHWH